MAESVDPESVPDNWTPDDDWDDEEERATTEASDAPPPPPPRRSGRRIIVDSSDLQPSRAVQARPRRSRGQAAPITSSEEQYVDGYGGFYGPHAAEWRSYERQRIAVDLDRPRWEIIRRDDGTFYQRRQGVSPAEVEAHVRATGDSPEPPTWGPSPSNDYKPRGRYPLAIVAEQFLILFGWSTKRSRTWLRKLNMLKGSSRKAYVRREDLESAMEKIRSTQERTAHGVPVGSVWRSERRILAHMDRDPDRSANWLHPTPVQPPTQPAPGAKRDLRLQPVLAGEEFTRLTVLAEGPKHPKYGRQWECLCECGKRLLVRQDRLISGESKSCGCLKDELNREHYARHLRRKAARTASDEVREIWEASATAPRRK